MNDATERLQKDTKQIMLSPNNGEQRGTALLYGTFVIAVTKHVQKGNFRVMMPLQETGSLTGAAVTGLDQTGT